MHDREEEKRRGSGGRVHAGGGAHVQIELASGLVLKKTTIKLWQSWERGSARTAWEDGDSGPTQLIPAIQ